MAAFVAAFVAAAEPSATVVIVLSMVMADGAHTRITSSAILTMIKGWRGRVLGVSRPGLRHLRQQLIVLGLQPGAGARRPGGGHSEHEQSHEPRGAGMSEQRHDCSSSTLPGAASKAACRIALRDLRESRAERRRLGLRPAAIAVRRRTIPHCNTWSAPISNETLLTEI
ncbi:hypothetical protein KXR53_30220 [Inquilinus limosus]|uniref:hypothetical protein n=1 Tax=Inquilinus limosus TaxID=171674 RepID=UPI003F18A2E0